MSLRTPAGRTNTKRWFMTAVILTYFSISRAVVMGTGTGRRSLTFLWFSIGASFCWDEWHSRLHTVFVQSLHSISAGRLQFMHSETNGSSSALNLNDFCNKKKWFPIKIGVKSEIGFNLELFKCSNFTFSVFVQFDKSLLFVSKIDLLSNGKPITQLTLVIQTFLILL